MQENITISKEEYESMRETIDILSNGELLRDIQDGIEDIRKGNTISLDRYLKR